jgi:hypothetical protein
VSAGLPELAADFQFSEKVLTFTGVTTPIVLCNSDVTRWFLGCYPVTASSVTVSTNRNTAANFGKLIVTNFPMEYDYKRHTVAVQQQWFGVGPAAGQQICVVEVFYRPYGFVSRQPDEMPQDVEGGSTLTRLSLAADSLSRSAQLLRSLLELIQTGAPLS